MAQKALALFIATTCSMSTSFQPTTSPNCVRSLADRLDHEAGIGAKQLESSLQMAEGDSSEEVEATTVEIPLRESRNCMFRLTALVGEASSLFLDEEAALGVNKHKTEIALAKIIMALMDGATTMNINLEKACHAKIDLNLKKYPANLCKGKAGKYTDYSSATGITKTVGQSTECASVRSDEKDDWRSTFLLEAVPSISLRAQQFATDRDWLPYHTPRNILLALTGELGELAELLQFKGDRGHASLSTSIEMKKISQELADVTIYLLRLSDVTDTSIGPIASSLKANS